MPTVRTTMRPDQPIEVDDAELLDLQRQGLLVEDGPAPDTYTGTGTPATTPKKTAGSAGSKES